MTVYTPAPGGGTTAPLTFTIGPIPNSVNVDDDFGPGNSGSGSWGYDAFSNIADGLNAVDDGGTLTVASGSYPENVVVDKPVTMLGANAGAAGCTGRGAESTVGTGTGTGITIASDGVTVDGFAVVGDTGIEATGFVSVELLSNLVTANALGINAGTIDTTAGGLTIEGNCVNLASQLAAGTPTVGVLLTAVQGPAAPTVVDNEVADAFYGYLLYAVHAAVETVVDGGSISGVMQGVSVINVDPVSGTLYAPTLFAVEGVTADSFAGDYSAIPALAPFNFHAGVYVFSGGADLAAKVTGRVTDVTVDGTGKPDQASAGLYFGDFSTGAGVMQDIAVEACVLTDNANRGLCVRGANAVVGVTQSVFTGNGYDPFGAGGNHGYGVIAREGAQLGMSECVVVNPAAVAGGYTVTALASHTGADVTAYGNSLDNNGCPAGSLANQSGTGGSLDASGNWWGIADEATIDGLITGAVDFTPFLDDGTDTDGGTPGFQGDFSTLHVVVAGAQTAGGRIQEGIDLVTASTVYLHAGTYTEGPQILVDKDLSLIGDGLASTLIQPAGDTSGSGYSTTRAWLLTDPGTVVEISDLTMDGAGKTIAFAVMSWGDLTISDCEIRNIQAGTYDGRAIVLVSGTSLVSDCSFSNIQRIGVHVRGAITTPAPIATILNCDYTGKGSGEWLDYGYEIGGGGQAVISNCSATACLGVAYDDSTSAGVLATDYYGTGSALKLLDSVLTGNTEGIAIGYADTDISLVMIEGTDLTGNETAGIFAIGGTVDAGDCTSSDITGLGSSAGGNDLSGYGFDNTGAFAIATASLAVNGNQLLAYGNEFGAMAGDEIQDVIYDGNDDGSLALIEASQAGVLLITCPAAVTVECLADVPTGATSWAHFLAQGGTASSTDGTVSFSDAEVITSINDRVITRTYELTDVCDTVETCDHVITVDDVTNPTITCPASVVTDTDPGECFAVVNGIGPVSTDDNCGIASVTYSLTGATSGTGTDDASGTEFNKGVTTVEYTVEDVGENTSTCSFTVTVEDNELPQIACPADITVNNDLGVCGAVVAYATPVGTDNCPGVSTFQTEGLASGSTFPVGTTTNTFVVTADGGMQDMCSFSVTVIDAEPPVAIAGTIDACFTTAGGAEAAAVAATTVSDNCAIASVTATADGTCDTTVTVTVLDTAGLSAQVVYSTRIDGTAPAITAVTAEQGGDDVKDCVANALQGTVAIEVTAGDDCGLDGAPSVALANGVANETATLVASGGGVYTYEWDITPATLTGTWNVTVTASDLCQTDVATFDLCVNTLEITGQVQLEGFSGTAVGHTRNVTFVATSGGVPVKTWVQTLANVAGDTFDYTLVDVPSGTDQVSAKAAWNLRKRLAVTWVGVAGSANFTGSHLLRGGDINHLPASFNNVNLGDYTDLAGAWLSSNAAADINGDGTVNVFDYSILAQNWYTAGDPE